MNPRRGSGMAFAEFLAAVKEPALRAVALHWEAARGARRMPGWQHIDAVAIAPYLRFVWSWKYDRASDGFTGRLAGEDINAAFGKPLRGVPMAEFFADWQYDLIFARSKRVVSEPAFAHGTGPVFAHARRYGTGERIILPLAADGISSDGILGATVYHWVSRPPEATEHRDPRQERVEFFPLD